MTGKLNIIDIQNSENDQKTRRKIPKSKMTVEAMLWPLRTT